MVICNFLLLTIYTCIFKYSDSRMGQKRLIEVVTITVDDKLDTLGALRNVAVKDAWQRLRQKIEVVCL